jgi:hypothetical protein
VHRLQAVAHVGDRAAHDHAHRVIEVGSPHLVLDADRLLLGMRWWWWGRGLCFVRHQEGPAEGGSEPRAGPLTYPGNLAASTAEVPRKRGINSNNFEGLA